MESMSMLTELVLEAQNDTTKIKGLIDRVCVMIYNDPFKFGIGNREHIGEIVAEAYKWMPRLIRKYQFSGKPFEMYLNTSLHWYRKSILQEEFRQARSFVNVEFDERIHSVCEDDDSEYFKEICDKGKQIGELAWGDCDSLNCDKKRMLVLALKCCEFLDEKMVERIAEYTGLPGSVISHCAHILRQGLDEKRKRYEILAQRRDEAFISICELDAKMRVESIPEIRRLLSLRLERVKRKRAIALREIRRINLAPAHFEIASLLGIPKGTVDSTIHFLKHHRSAMVSQNEELEYAEAV